MKLNKTETLIMNALEAKGVYYIDYCPGFGRIPQSGVREKAALQKLINKGLVDYTMKKHPMTQHFTVTLK
jgi:hypothetical protein